MKLKSIILLAVVTLASSCGISDLEDRVGKIENALGTNEPFTVKFSTKNYDDVDVADNTTYLFKSGGDSEYIGINPDGTIEEKNGNKERLRNGEYLDGEGKRYENQDRFRERMEQRVQDRNEMRDRERIERKNVTEPRKRVGE